MTIDPGGYTIFPAGMDDWLERYWLEHPSMTENAAEDAQDSDEASENDQAQQQQQQQQQQQDAGE